MIDQLQVNHDEAASSIEGWSEQLATRVFFIHGLRMAAKVPLIIPFIKERTAIMAISYMALTAAFAVLLVSMSSITILCPSLPLFRAAGRLRYRSPEGSRRIQRCRS